MIPSNWWITEAMFLSRNCRQNLNIYLPLSFSKVVKLTRSHIHDVYIWQGDVCWRKSRGYDRFILWFISHIGSRYILHILNTLISFLLKNYTLIKTKVLYSDYGSVYRYYLFLIMVARCVSFRDASPYMSSFFLNSVDFKHFFFIKS